MRDVSATSSLGNILGSDFSIPNSPKQGRLFHPRLGMGISKSCSSMSSIECGYFYPDPCPFRVPQDSQALIDPTPSGQTGHASRILVNTKHLRHRTHNPLEEQFLGSKGNLLQNIRTISPKLQFLVKSTPLGDPCTPNIFGYKGPTWGLHPKVTKLPSNFHVHHNIVLIATSLVASAERRLFFLLRSAIRYR